MAATLAGVCQVPLTSVLLLFELTRDYRIILPLMGAVGLASWLASTTLRKKKPPLPLASVPLQEASGQTEGADAETIPSDQTGNGPLRSKKLPKLDISDEGLGGERLGEGGGSTIGSERERRRAREKLPPAPIDSPGRRFMSRAKQLLEASEGMSSRDNRAEICLVDSSLCVTDMAMLEEQLLEEINAVAAMRTNYAHVPVDATVGDAMHAMLCSREWCVLVVAEGGTLEGMLTLADIQQEAQRLMLEGLPTNVESLPVSALCTGRAHGDPQRALLTVRPDSTLRSALNMMTPRGLRQLPVVVLESPENVPTPNEDALVLLGLLHREDIFLACRTEATKRVVGVPDTQTMLTNSGNSLTKRSEEAVSKAGK
eukprot:TRINITY_DN11800_c0_g2_i1.p1 TRINITY_DN11800_c0_g2~~TRINITY_DN11800_c0_g2_i1.p1  ORF type:complete len:379 (+),score=56.77 TRINITY_DN11800_c0_g2_i1:25-1137(+)